MKIDDKRVCFDNAIGYHYYIGKQRYILVAKMCPECGDEFLARPYKTRDKEQVFCSMSCRAKQPKPSTQKDKHWAWKGGKYHTNSGYTMVKNGDTYALEHRMVMEKSLGRPLEPFETVHHKNGNRTDNRSENLELWCSRHPKGQSVEYLISWAKWILQTYSV